MIEGHWNGKRIRLGTFPIVKRGSWILKISVTDHRSIMALCVSETDPENTFLRFFFDKEEMDSFIDFLVLHDHYDLGADE